MVSGDVAIVTGRCLRSCVKYTTKDRKRRVFILLEIITLANNKSFLVSYWLRDISPRLLIGPGEIVFNISRDITSSPKILSSYL